jgi:hypothetical protein
MGLPKLLEYVLRFDLLDMVGRISFFLSRLSASLALLRQSETCELHLSFDRSTNSASLFEFMSKNK